MLEIDLPTLDKSVHKTRLWLDDVMTGLETTSRIRSFRALRAVLQTLRDMLPVEEGAHLASQLPLIVRGVFYEGWRPNLRPSRLRRMDEFLGAVAELYGDVPRAEVEKVCHAVFTTLKRHVTPGEVADVLVCLPAEIRRFLNTDDEPWAEASHEDEAYPDEGTLHL